MRIAFMCQAVPEGVRTGMALTLQMFLEGLHLTLLGAYQHLRPEGFSGSTVCVPNETFPGVQLL